jgi:hypothetical protein
MSRFFHSHFSQLTPPVNKEVDSAKPLAGMLLAAVLAALLVVANELIDSWTNGHLLAGWVALWTAVFAALALMLPPLRQLSSAMALAFARWSHTVKQRCAGK